MRVFLLSCLAVVVIGVGAYAVLEGLLSENAGTAFAIPGSTRISDSYKPDPRGYLSQVHSPAGGITFGRSPGAGTDERVPKQPTGGAQPTTR